MTILNNFIHNDYVWIPLYIGMIGFLGHAWFTESTRIFTSVNPVNNMTSGSPGLESISQSTLTPRTFNFTPEQLMFSQNYRDQEVQTLSNITNRSVISGPRTTLQEVIVDQNIRMTHWERSYNLTETRDSQICLMDKMVQTDLNVMMHTINNSTLFHDYVTKSEQLADFVGVWTMFQ
jgi:hypothetical protein